MALQPAHQAGSTPQRFFTTQADRGALAVRGGVEAVDYALLTGFGNAEHNPVADLAAVARRAVERPVEDRKTPLRSFAVAGPPAKLWRMWSFPDGLMLKTIP
jgi:hypothetical protein